MLAMANRVLGGTVLPETDGVGDEVRGASVHQSSVMHKSATSIVYNIFTLVSQMLPPTCAVWPVLQHVYLGQSG